MWRPQASCWICIWSYGYGVRRAVEWSQESSWVVVSEETLETPWYSNDWCRVLNNTSQFSSVQFSRSVVSDSLQPHELQHARPPCPSPTPGVHQNPCLRHISGCSFHFWNFVKAAGIEECHCYNFNPLLPPTSPHWGRRCQEHPLRSIFLMHSPVRAIREWGTCLQG